MERRRWPPGEPRRQPARSRSELKAAPKAAPTVIGLLLGALALAGCVTLPEQPVPMADRGARGPAAAVSRLAVTSGQSPALSAPAVDPGLAATGPASPPAPTAPPTAWRPVRLNRMDIAFQRPADFLPDGRSGPQGGRRAWTHPEHAVVLGVVQYRRPGVDGAAETARFLTGLVPDGRLGEPAPRRINGIDFLTRAGQGAEGWVRVAFTRQNDENLLAYTVVARTGFPARDQANRATAERFLASFGAVTAPTGQD